MKTLHLPRVTQSCNKIYICSYADKHSKYWVIYFPEKRRNNVICLSINFIKLHTFDGKVMNDIFLTNLPAI